MKLIDLATLLIGAKPPGVEINRLVKRADNIEEQAARKLSLLFSVGSYAEMV
ncbi:hypothetical protein V7139_13790 [Neobacillus drentensis]|uniref:hypothetical protein n=1 Tax=Neobacillus drentensis TaxID=220684 RepID=UPI00300147FD